MSPYPDTVRDLIAEIKNWYREGFLHDSVWKELARYIEPDLLPTEAEISRMKRAVTIRNSISGKWLLTTTVLILLVAWTMKTSGIINLLA